MNISSTIGGFPVYDSNRPGEVISPTVINSYSALTIPAYWRAINFLADNLSSFPRSVHQNGSPADIAHPLNKILKRKPNAYANSTTVWRTFFGHAANYGNGYIRIDRNLITGTANALHNVLPEDVWPFRYDAGDGFGVLQYYYVKSVKVILSSNDMLHISALSYDGIKGHDVVFMHRESLQRGITLDRYMTRYLQKGTVVRGAIEIPTGATPEQVETLMTLMRTQFRGADAEEDVMVLSDGAKFNNTTLSAQESQLIEQGAYTTKQIAQITGVPPQFLYEFGEQKYNGTSVEAMGQDVVRFTFRPWIEQIEDELTLKLLTEAEQDAGYEVKLDVNALIRGDSTATTTTVTARVKAGIETQNEGRKELGLPPSTDPEADKLKTSGDTAPPPAKPTPTPPQDHAKDPSPTSQQFSAVKEHLNLSHFSDVIADAADRVHKKTDKAIEGNAKKFDNNPQGWTAWSNVFTTEQTHYAATAIGPVLKTFANLSGKSVEGMADKAGVQYGRALGIHLIQVGQKQASTPPDLAAITIALGGNPNEPSTIA